jgi:hypothetical protein
MRRLLLTTAAGLMAATAANGQALLADSNKDGKVTQAEYQTSRRAFLMRADRDKDGKLSAAEWSKGAEQVKTQARREGVDGWPLIGKAGLFTTLDTSKDGYVTPTEIDAYYGPRFTALDPNHDGVVTRSEADRIQKAIPKP